VSENEGQNAVGGERRGESEAGGRIISLVFESVVDPRKRRSGEDRSDERGEIPAEGEREGGEQGGGGAAGLHLRSRISGSGNGFIAV